MIDLNEITGFVAHCTNAAYLKDLLGQVQERLQQLGVPRVLPPQPLRDPRPKADEAKDGQEALDGILSRAGATPQPLATTAVVDKAPVSRPDYSKFPPEMAERLNAIWDARHQAEG